MEISLLLKEIVIKLLLYTGQVVESDNEQTN